MLSKARYTHSKTTLTEIRQQQCLLGGPDKSLDEEAVFGEVWSVSLDRKLSDGRGCGCTLKLDLSIPGGSRVNWRDLNVLVMELGELATPKGMLG
jgi:hypothetical protein